MTVHGQGQGKPGHDDPGRATTAHEFKQRVGKDDQR